MTLKQLEAFYWAATCANFAIAAQRLHLSISSLSKRISELEESLNTPLFDRTGHRATLTEIGQILLPKALLMLEAAHSIRKVVVNQEHLMGRCRFGIGELTAMTWLTKLIVETRKQHPKLLLEPHVDVGATLETLVERGELDFAIIAGRSSKHSIQSVTIAQAEFVWTVSTALIKTNQNTDLFLQPNLPIITLPPTAGTTRLIDDWLFDYQQVKQERIYCNHWGAILGMLTSSVGIGILPKTFAIHFEKQGLLHILQTKKPLAPLSYAFQWKRDDYRPLLTYMQTLVTKLADFTNQNIFVP